MGKIYCTPAEIPAPEFDWDDIPAYDLKEQKFIEDLKAYCIKRNGGQYIGEVIQFPVADSYAQYMIAGLSPVELIHLPLVDGWQFQYVERLTKKDIIDKIIQKQSLDKFIQSMK